MDMTVSDSNNKVEEISYKLVDSIPFYRIKQEEENSHCFSTSITDFRILISLLRIELNKSSTDETTFDLYKFNPQCMINNTNLKYNTFRKDVTSNNITKYYNELETEVKLDGENLYPIISIGDPFKEPNNHTTTYHYFLSLNNLIEKNNIIKNNELWFMPLKSICSSFQAFLTNSKFDTNNCLKLEQTSEKKSLLFKEGKLQDVKDSINRLLKGFPELEIKEESSKFMYGIIAFIMICFIAGTSFFYIKKNNSDKEFNSNDEFKNQAKDNEDDNSINI